MIKYNIYLILQEETNIVRGIAKTVKECNSLLNKYDTYYSKAIIIEVPIPISGLEEVRG